MISFILFAFGHYSRIVNTDKQNEQFAVNKYCDVESVTLKTERTEKKRKFLFWTLKHNKVLVIDRVLDSNGNELLKEKSVFICSMDACDDRKFRRIKIVENEIWIFSYGKNPEKTNPIKKYNFCGEYIGRKKWENGDYHKN